LQNYPPPNHETKNTLFPAHREKPAVILEYSALVGCTLAEFLNQFLDDFLVCQFSDPDNREVDEERLRQLGPPTDFHIVESTEIYFYSS
jgi:hypothetical protein